jgi:hypothetical protein
MRNNKIKKREADNDKKSSEVIARNCRCKTAKING